MSCHVCGDGNISLFAGEVCDDRNSIDGDGCSANCRSDETCGNVYVDDTMGEVCDDGNSIDGDGCSADCSSNKTCGNGVLDVVQGEICDDGNIVSLDGCSDSCQSDTAFRINSLEIRDPHFYISLLGCHHITSDVDDLLASAIVADGGDGYLDSSLVTCFDRSIRVPGARHSTLYSPTAPPHQSKLPVARKQ